MACRVNIISFSGGNFVHIYIASLSSNQAWPQGIEEIEQFCPNDSVNFILFGAYSTWLIKGNFIKAQIAEGKLCKPWLKKC